jgi:hypothetical protein
MGDERPEERPRRDEDGARAARIRAVLMTLGMLAMVALLALILLGPLADELDAPPTTEVESRQG